MGCRACSPMCRRPMCCAYTSLADYATLPTLPSRNRLLAIAALHHELYSVVAATLLGSILSNLLLVMGTSFFVGEHTRHSLLRAVQ